MRTSDPPRSAFEDVNGVRVHALVAGAGEPVILLHGWPEFSGVWRRNIPALAASHRVVAPDLRDFGKSRTLDPATAPLPTPDVYAADLVALMDRLDIARAAIVSHDIGAFVAQFLARTRPDRVSRLVFFDCPHPAIGARYGAPDHAIETWYQHFQRLPLAARLVGHDRETCRMYLRHFLDHLSGDPNAFADVIEEWVDVHMEPGALEGGFAWYRAVWPLRKAMIEGTAPPPPVIEHPTLILWGREDPVTPIRWSDTLDRSFTNFILEPVDGAGHFPHGQRPDVVNPRILAFLGAGEPADEARAGQER